MAIRVVWDNAEKTIVRMDFEASWGWTDVHAALETLDTMRLSIDRLVAVIVNLTTANVMPLEGSITNLQYALNRIAVQIVFVAAKPIGKSVLDILSNVQPALKHQIAFATTLDEARKLLADPPKP